MNRHRLSLRPMRLAALTVLLTTAGCTPDGKAPHDADQDATIPTMELQPMNEWTPEGDPAGAGSDATPDTLAEAAEAARRDLAERLGRSPDTIEVAEQRWVTWRDGAVGCPEPGAMYTQALVPGVLIRLTADGTTYDYHGARDRRPFFCPAERAEAPLPADDAPQA